MGDDDDLLHADGGTRLPQLGVGGGGDAIAVALTRGLARRSGRLLGNFWVDMVRCTLYVLLPICFIYTLFLVWQGVPQNLNADTSATTLEGATQTMAQGR